PAVTHLLVQNFDVILAGAVGSGVLVGLFLNRAVRHVHPSWMVRRLIATDNSPIGGARTCLTEKILPTERLYPRAIRSEAINRHEPNTALPGPGVGHQQIAQAVMHPLGRMR